MNKRKIKKMLNKKRDFEGFVRLEGNKGGDFVEITDRGDGTIHLSSGSCCVMTVNAIVPVEFLTSIIERVMLDNELDVNQVIETSGWSREFKESLKAKVIDKY